MSHEISKYIDLAIKYRIQISYLISLFIVIAAYVAGKYNTICPPKEEVCTQYTKERDTAKGQLKTATAKCLEEKRELSDKKDSECKISTRKALDNKKVNSIHIDCETAFALSKTPQCKDFFK